MQIVREPAELSRAAQSCADAARPPSPTTASIWSGTLEQPRHIGSAGAVATITAGRSRSASVSAACSVRTRKSSKNRLAGGLLAGPEGAEGAALYIAPLSMSSSVQYRGAGYRRVRRECGRRAILPGGERSLAGRASSDRGGNGLDLVEQQLRVASGEPLAQPCSSATSRGTRSRLASTPKIPVAVSSRSLAVSRSLRGPSGEGIRVDAGVQRRARGDAALRPHAGQDHRLR